MVCAVANELLIEWVDASMDVVTTRLLPVTGLCLNRYIVLLEPCRARTHIRTQMGSTVRVWDTERLRTDLAQSVLVGKYNLGSVRVHQKTTSAPKTGTADCSQCHRSFKGDRSTAVITNLLNHLQVCPQSVAEVRCAGTMHMRRQMH